MAGFTLFGSTHQLLSLSMRLRAMRHEFLAANIANADTPGYRARDLDFSAALRALASPETAPARAGESGIQLVGSRAFDSSQRTVDDSLIRIQEAEGKLDRNSVDVDRQMATLVENSLSYETSIALLARTLAGLRYAIGEGRR